MNSNVFSHKVFISLVKSPTYSSEQINQHQLDKSLYEYFSITRTFKLNDHFEIKSFNSEYWEVDYQFKIVKVEPDTQELFQITNAQTTLVQLEHTKTNWIWFHSKFNSILDEYTEKLNRVVSYYDKYHQESDNWPVTLLYGPSGCGKTRVVESLCSKLSYHLLKTNGINLSGDSASAVEKRIEIFLNQALNYGPCIILIRSFHLMFKLKDINEINKRIVSFLFQSIRRLKQQNDAKFFVVLTTSSKQTIDSTVASYLNYELEVEPLNESQRRLALEEFIQNKQIETSLSENEIKDWIKKTSGFYYGELQTVFDLIKLDSSKSSSQLQDALNIFFQNRKFQQENKLNIEQVNWNDVGGLQNIKEIISDTILLPLNYPELFRSTDKQLGITRSGILLYGPPGTGKTLLAKAISNECEINFLSVKGPELLDMYVGQTEQNVRNLFEKARLNSPCILFFDELDSLAPVRGRAGDSGGVMDRVVSQLLTEIDGLDKFSSNQSGKQTQIFLIGATNRPDLIDASLLRPGRFDKLIYVPIAQTLNERLNIFKALTRKLPIDKEFNMELFVANKCPLNLTGADFYAITNKARHHALKRLIQKGETNLNDLDESSICLNETDFVSAIETFQPSLSEQMLRDYDIYFKNYSNKNK